MVIDLSSPGKAGGGWIDYRPETLRKGRYRPPGNRYVNGTGWSRPSSGGPRLETVYIGSLKGKRIPYFRAPVPGLPMVHWNDKYS